LFCSVKESSCFSVTRVRHFFQGCYELTHNFAQFLFAFRTKGGKFRDIDLLNEARRPLYTYLQHGGRDQESPYAFTSQRSARLTEDGIHHWFRTLKQQSNHEEWELIAELSFHDLRHDFAHRAREAGWSLEEVAYYLGHVTMKGTPAIQTTARYTQVSRAQVKEKLRLLKG
jgi:site-specific recombinase XerD